LRPAAEQQRIDVDDEVEPVLEPVLDRGQEAAAGGR
jgi:hypothetical protein